MRLSDLEIVIEKYQELQRLHQLNAELLEQLNVTCSYFVEAGIPFPNFDVLYSLFRRSKALLNEIQAGTPKMVQYKALQQTKSNRIYGDEETDGDVTEPAFIRLLYVVMGSWILQQFRRTRY